MDRQGGSEGPNEVRSVIASTVGGVITEEAGAMTGDLEVATRAGLGGVEVLVRYDGADEWYTVEGSPIEPGNNTLPPSKLLRELHERVVRHLTTPGKVMDGNEEAVSLEQSPQPPRVV